MRLRARLAFQLMRFVALQLRACEDSAETNPELDRQSTSPLSRGTWRKARVSQGVGMFPWTPMRSQSSHLA